jgi:hypothetical protein
MHAAAIAALSAAALLAACLDRGPGDLLGNSAPDRSGRQPWTIILSDDAGRVLIAQTDSALAPGEDSAAVGRATLWRTLDGPAEPDSFALGVQAHGRRLEWSLRRAGQTVGSGSGALLAYPGDEGAPRYAGLAAITLAGVPPAMRFDAIGGLPMPADMPAPVAPLPIAARGVVSLRVDDCSAWDSTSLRLLERHHLVASFAVPSRLVGRPGRCSRDLLERIAGAGNAIDAHSRYHDAAPAGFADFYIEAVGASRDLRAMGFDAAVFVQPGSWTVGPALFDSPAKLATPYGALIRRVYRALEAYQTDAASVPLPAAGRWPYAGEIRYFDRERLAAFVRDAAARGEWVEFLWHSGDQPWDALDGRLAVIAAMRDSGYVANLTFRDALRAVPPAP